MCNEIINVAYSVSTNMTTTVPTNVTSTISINSYNEKARYNMDCYILHTFLLVTISLFIIPIIWYYYAKHRSLQQKILAH